MVLDRNAVEDDAMAERQRIAERAIQAVHVSKNRGEPMIPRLGLNGISTRVHIEEGGGLGWGAIAKRSKSLKRFLMASDYPLMKTAYT